MVSDVIQGIFMTESLNRPSVDSVIESLDITEVYKALFEEVPKNYPISSVRWASHFKFSQFAVINKHNLTDTITDTVLSTLGYDKQTAKFSDMTWSGSIVNRLIGLFVDLGLVSVGKEIYALTAVNSKIVAIVNQEDCISFEVR